MSGLREIKITLQSWWLLQIKLNFYPLTDDVKRDGRSSHADLLQAGHESARFRLMIHITCGSHLSWMSVRSNYPTFCSAAFISKRIGIKTHYRYIPMHILFPIIKVFVTEIRIPKKYDEKKLNTTLTPNIDRYLLDCNG
jgi:hypothetical protein